MILLWLLFCYFLWFTSMGRFTVHALDTHLCGLHDGIIFNILLYEAMEII